MHLYRLEHNLNSPAERRANRRAGAAKRLQYGPQHEPKVRDLSRAGLPTTGDRMNRLAGYACLLLVAVLFVWLVVPGAWASHSDILPSLQRAMVAGTGAGTGEAAQ